MTNSSLSLSRILKVWIPLAASWLLMGMELPILSAVVARLIEPEINLAAYGGIVFPIALIIEAPIIMLLAASTALSKDWASYKKLYTYMMLAGGVLTAFHLLLALSPLYYTVAEDLLGAPSEIIEPARIGLIIMVPWTWTIAYRRQLTYKGEWYGCQVKQIDPWYPSSKTCSACGAVMAEMPLHIRSWECPECQAHHDRDINAARNILNQATVGTTESYAGGVRVRPLSFAEAGTLKPDTPLLAAG